MSTLNGKPVENWIGENCPENGLFRAYWTEDGEGISLEDTGYGLRYEWYYKDGKRADGVSKGWWPDGQLKQTQTWKDGKSDGIRTEWFKNGEWYENGQEKEREETFKGEKKDGLRTRWYENGHKKFEMTYKNGELNGLWTRWYNNGQKEYEKNWKDGKLNGLFFMWYDNGQKMREENYKDGELINQINQGEQNEK